MLHFLPTTWRKYKIFQLILFITFFISAILVLPIVYLSYFIVYNLNIRLYKAIINRCTYFLYMQITYIAQWWNDLRITVFSDDKTWSSLGNEHGLFIMNHKYDMDWLANWLVSEKIGTLGGGFCFAKMSLRHLPIIGWIWRLNGTIFLHRDWNRDQKLIRDGLHGFTNTCKGYYNMLLLFPEATRFSDSKQQASAEYALSRGMVPLKHCLIPRTRGFVEIINSMRVDKLEYPATESVAIYDLTVGFPESRIDGSGRNLQKKFTLNNVLSGNVQHGSIHCRRFGLEDLPEGDDELAEWLQEIFRYKDNLFDQYIRTGSFPDKPHRVEPNKVGLCVYCIYFLFLWLPILYLLITMVIFHSNWTTLFWCGSVVAIFYICLEVYKRVTSIDKGSNYGASSN